MSEVAIKRELIVQAHLLVKTNEPAESFIACARLLDALGSLWSEWTGEVVEIRMTLNGKPNDLRLVKRQATRDQA